jgi:hypothetical protein
MNTITITALDLSGKTIFSTDIPEEQMPRLYRVVFLRGVRIAAAKIGGNYPNPGDDFAEQYWRTFFRKDEDSRVFVEIARWNPGVFPFNRIAFRSSMIDLVAPAL